MVRVTHALADGSRAASPLWRHGWAVVRGETLELSWGAETRRSHGYGHRTQQLALDLTRVAAVEAYPRTTRAHDAGRSVTCTLGLGQWGSMVGFGQSVASAWTERRRGDGVGGREVLVLRAQLAESGVRGMDGSSGAAAAVEAEDVEVELAMAVGVEDENEAEAEAEAAGRFDSLAEAHQIMFGPNHDIDSRPAVTSAAAAGDDGDAGCGTERVVRLKKVAREGEEAVEDTRRRGAADDPLSLCRPAAMPTEAAELTEQRTLYFGTQVGGGCARA